MNLEIRIAQNAGTTDPSILGRFGTENPTSEHTKNVRYCPLPPFGKKI